MDLKKAHRIPQKPKDCVYGYIKSAQSLLPTDSAYFYIVDLIKHLILLFYYSTLESEILNDEDQDKFLKLLKDNDKSIANMEFEWVYKQEKKWKGYYRYAWIRGKIKKFILTQIEKNSMEKDNDSITTIDDDPGLDSNLQPQTEIS